MPREAGHYGNPRKGYLMVLEGLGVYWDLMVYGVRSVVSFFFFVGFRVWGLEVGVWV